ncbi:hypothetical protein [Streptomyces millisiae]|uniref:Bacterial transcriptional activator domain-containing protein n=1 Tax=Streptomyces millisiae TaxID=3075542 RepID=A0ABU2LV51_9ACTN|nr:hypothetical protein [Streptomyces sp. DSM 44918]MDT0321459.1 hypothetical protein [Streptomyces sp. DSM 44918]
MITAGRLIRAAIAAALLLVLLVGIPWGLVHYIGWPLPTRIPSHDDITTALSTQLTISDTLTVLACVLWTAWLMFVVDVARSLRDTSPALSRTHLRPRSPTHALAAALVGMLTLGPFTPVPRITPMATPLILHQPHPAQEHEQPATMTLNSAPPSANAAEDARGAVTVLPPRDGVYDSLWRIAERTLGDGARWPEVFTLNEGRPQTDGTALTHPDLIRPGWILHLPELTMPPEPDNQDDETEDEQPNEPTRPGESTEPSSSPEPSQPIPSPSPEEASPPHDESPPPETADPDTPEAADDDGGAVLTPSGAFVGLGLAALITAAWCTVLLRRRTRYRPGAPRRDEPEMAPIVRALRTAHDHAHQPTDDTALLELERIPHPSPRAVPEAALRERARTAAASGNQAVGIDAGRAVALDLARTRGLGLSGPGTRAAARALLVRLLADLHRPDAQPADVLVPAADADLLLGPGASRPPHSPHLHVVADLDEALSVLESELLTRTRATIGSPHEAESVRDLVLIATPRPETAGRLQAILDNGSTLGLMGVLLAPWHPGSTIRVRGDGTIAATNPTAPHPLHAGMRLFTLPSDDAQALNDLLRKATPTSHPPEPAHHSPAANGATTPPRPASRPDEPDHRSRRPHDPANSVVNEAPTEPTRSSTNPDPSSASAPRDPPIPDNGPAASPPGPQPSREDVVLHIAVLGRINLTLHQAGSSTPVDITSSLAPRHRELLAFLTLHPKGAHRDIISAALWPDAGRPHNAFHATLSQLRRALRTTHDALGDIIRHDNGHYALDDTRVTIDLTQLREALAAQHRASTTSARSSALRRIGDLYRGDLASDLTGLWLETPREALRRDVLDAHSALIRELRDSDSEQALALLEQAREIDPYNESIYRGIARMQALLGQHDAIPRTLSLLTAALAEIDEEPGPETIAFLDSLQRIKSPDSRSRR